MDETVEPAGVVFFVGVVVVDGHLADVAVLQIVLLALDRPC